MITQQQYLAVCLDSLGLRANASAKEADLQAASYTMGLTEDKATMQAGPPNNWDALLSGTIAQILSFQNHQQQFLTIVEPSTGTSLEYGGCFPKCSVKPTRILASTQIGNQTQAQLVAWVEHNIPN
jgi:hypothetical protein